MAISANIDADINFGRVPFVVNLNAVNLVDSEDISGYYWQFGDGQTSTQKNPSHTYKSYGDHTVSLTVTSFSGDTNVDIEADFIRGLQIDFREEIIVKQDRYTVLFINESQIPTGYSVDSWEWDFGDGSIFSEEYSPSHDYVSRGRFSPTLNAVVSGPGGFQETFSITKDNLIVRDPRVYNTCNKFLCIGWVRKPSFSASGSPLYPFVTSDIYYRVLDSEDAIKFAILKDGEDYRLEFMGAKTKIINKNIGIDLADGKWHSLVYTCIKDDGTMRFLIDGVDVPNEDGFNSDGYTFSIAHGETSRPGGGNLWSPYLYESGQGIQLYNWRFKAGLNIPDLWLNELLDTLRRLLLMSP
jgi:hypothetical protein